MRKWILLILCVLYLFFPTHNSSTDAWFYAASVKYGESLFLPHHLLHSAFLWLIYKALNCFVAIDAMVFCKGMSAIFATILMAIFAKILAILGKKETEIAAYTFLVGVSFGIWRYAGENETYILPLIFSLTALFFYLKNPNDLHFCFFSGFFAAFACLFHQLQIVWAIGLGLSFLFYGKKKWILAYLLPFLLVPITYFAVYFFAIKANFSLTDFMAFVLHDFQNGSATLSVGFWNIILTILNIFRSFLQIHGSILQQIKGNFFYIFPIVLGAIFLFVVRKKPLKPLIQPIKNAISVSFLLFFLQIFFAFLAMGNAEFMVMLPLLVAILVAAKWEIPAQSITFVGISLFAWNFTYGIFPQYNYPQSPYFSLQKHILAHPQDTYLLESRPMIANRIYYDTKEWHFAHLQHAPAIWLSKGQSLDSLSFICDSILKKGGHVFTDAYKKPTIHNRESVRYSAADSLFWKKYTWKQVENALWEISYTR